METFDSMRYRCGLVDSREFYANDPSVRVVSPRRLVVTEPQDNVIVVENGALGSIHDLLKALLARIAERIVEQLPRYATRDGVRLQSVPGLVVIAYLNGTQWGAVPMRTEIRLEIDPQTRQEIHATVAIDDGTYDPRDYRMDREEFAVHWTAPVEDLVGQVVRYMHSRQRGRGRKGE